VIVPATANIIGKILNGIADDIVSAMAIATPKSVEKMIYPAMNSVMLENAYMNKLGELKEKDWHLGDTQEKRLACGSVGKGALQSTKEIVSMMEYMYERWILNRKSKNEC
jgi:phosphopantothenoylcysteine synthetase/decarboxylase